MTVTALVPPARELGTLICKQINTFTFETGYVVNQAMHLGRFLGGDKNQTRVILFQKGFQCRLRILESRKPSAANRTPASPVEDNDDDLVCRLELPKRLWVGCQVERHIWQPWTLGRKRVNGVAKTSTNALYASSKTVGYMRASRTPRALQSSVKAHNSGNTCTALLQSVAYRQDRAGWLGGAPAPSFSSRNGSGNAEADPLIPWLFAIHGTLP